MSDLKRITFHIISYNPAKGFGFISYRPPTGLFFHRNSFTGNKHPGISPTDVVEFSITENESRGRPIASNIVWISEGFREHGVITHWKHDRGFGFAQIDGGEDRVFVHVSDYMDDGNLQVNDRITLCLGTGKEPGQLKAYRLRRED